MERITAKMRDMRYVNLEPGYVESEMDEFLKLYQQMRAENRAEDGL